MLHLSNRSLVELQGVIEGHFVVTSELADVLTYCFLLADKLGLDAEAIVLEKLEQKKAKYPVEKSRGNDRVGLSSLTPRCIQTGLHPRVFRGSVV